MARLGPAGGISISNTSTQQARMDATAMLSAKMVEALEGNVNPQWEHMQEMMHEPERLAAAAMSIMNLFWAWATDNGNDVSKIAKIIEYNVKNLQEDTHRIKGI